MERVYIAIGSNLNNPLKQVENAIKELRYLSYNKSIIVSSFYRSKPMKFLQHPEYLNVVVSFITNLLPHILLKKIQYIEHKNGRKRNHYKWEPRTLDLDIILYGKLIINSNTLIIPHYDYKNREFVLYPLAEITSNLYLPNNKSLNKLLSTINNNELTLW